MKYELLVALLAASAPAAEKPASPGEMPDLRKAAWIWNDKAALRDGALTCYFRREIDLPAKPTAATVLATADNGYDLYVNGSVVGGDTGYDSAYWQSIEKYDIAHLLKAGRNVVAIRGANLGGAAGLVAAMRVELAGRPAIEVCTDRTWRFSVDSQTGWTSAEFDASSWPAAVELGRMGLRPWGPLAYPGPVSPARRGGRGGTRGFAEPAEDFRWPGAVVFLTGRVPESSTRLPQCVWRIAGSRAYLEMDKLGPSVLGRQMHVLRPAEPDARARLLLDAGGGVLGSPSVSWDGRWVYFSLAGAGEKFLHVWRIAASGGEPQELTDGPFHDFDPAELPDGRIVFSSTRIGSREEYHGNSARSLFTMNADGSGIRPLTVHIVGDNEPRVTADGLVAFIRCDNFLERAKVETQIHVVRPDGTAGIVLMGADRYAIGYDRATAAEQNSNWLRRFGYGSPAPLPDGRVACLSSHGLVISTGGIDPPARVPAATGLFDISPLPDGRLLCTVAGQGALGVLDPRTGDVVRLHSRDTYDMHSPVYLGPRPRPPAIPPSVPEDADGAGDATGFLLCQSVFNTKQTAADMARVRAIRVYEGRPLTLRSAKHSYDHIGVEAVELGTAPLAPDGSFYVEVPADRALALQAVDAEGRGVVNELSWIYVRPGERRSCVGCHSPRPGAPASSRKFLALNAPPVKLLGRGDPHRYRGNNAANGGVLNLQLDRFRETAAIDLHDLRPPKGVSWRAYLEQPTSRREHRRLVRRMRDGSVAEKVAAARRWAILRRPRRCRDILLLRPLRDDSADVRMSAALALAACGDRDCIEALLAALDDPSPAAAQAACVALENLTGHAEPFSAYGPPAERQAAAQAWRTWIAEHDAADIERGLIARLSQAGAAERYRAVVALGHVGADAARAALRELLRRDDGADLRTTLEATRALGYLEDARAVPLLRDVLRAGVEESKQRGKGFHELGWWQRGPHRSAAAAEALGRIATPEAESALLEAFGRLGDFWRYTYHTGDHDWLMGCHASVVHFRIIEALDQMGSTRGGGVAEAMCRSIPIDTDRGLLLETDTYEKVTARVLHRAGVADAMVETCLAVLGDARAAGRDRWRAAVTASPPARSVGALSPEARAAQVLSILCLDPAPAPRVRAAFDRYRAAKTSRKRSWVCFFLARALGKVRDGGSVDSLIAALEGDATEASFGRPDPPNVFLHDAMTPCYRAAAADALGRIGDRRAGKALLAAVRDFDNAVDVRHAAAGALARLADPALLPELRKLARGYPEVTMRRALRQAEARSRGASR